MSTRDELESRWQHIAAELKLIASGEQPDGLYPYDRETALLAEQDRIEWAIGELDSREEENGREP
jgi:hypothetical protein